MNEKFAQRLKKAMELKNIKASELSEKADIPKSAISQYLSGLYEAKQKSIFKLANALDVSEAWLMGLDVPMERTLPLQAIWDFSTENERKILNDAIVYAIQNNIQKDDISTNDTIQKLIANLENLNQNQAIAFIQNLSSKFYGKNDFNLEEYIKFSLNRSNDGYSPNEYTPNARAIARGFDKLPPDKQKLYMQLLNSMLDDTDED